MWVPFQIPAEGMKDHNKAGSEVHGFVLFIEHAGNDAADGMKQTVKQGAVIQEKLSKVFVNGKYTVAVGNVNQLEGHGSSALHGVEVSAGGAETAVAAERDKFQFSAVRTAIHGSTEGGIAAVDHFFDIFHLAVTGMEGKFDFFIMIFKNFL